MSSYLPFLVAGIAAGALYGLTATGLVLTYKSSGILNLGHGAVAAACAYVFYELRTVHGLPWPVALIGATLVFAPLLGGALELLGRQLAAADTASQIVATVGFLVLVQGVIAWYYGSAPLQFDPIFSEKTFSLGSVRVGYDQLSTIAISVACVLALLAFFRWTRLGLRMRAVVDNAQLLDLTGASPARTRRAAWAIGCAFAGLSGILLATFVGLDITILTLLVLQAFGAASVGRFERIGITYVAALAIGVGGELIKKWVPDVPVLSGLPPSLPFLVLFAVLLISPVRDRISADKTRHRRVRHAVPARTTFVLCACAAMLVVLAPTLVGARLSVYTNAAIYVMLFVSLAILVRLSGQVSLCQMSFAAVGATTFSHLQELHVPWALAFVAAGLIAVPLGAFLSIPAIRLSGLYLGLATFGFAVVLEQLFFRTSYLFGDFGVRTATRPGVLGLGTDEGFFYLCAALAAASIVAGVVVARSRLGRLLRGMADSPVALSTHGTNVNVTRVIVFCLASFIAGLAGALLITLTGTASASGTTFGFFQSLFLLVVLAICGRSLVVAPVLAAVLLAVLPSYSTNPDFGSLQQIAFGAVAIGVAGFGPVIAQLVRRAASTSMWRRSASPVADRRRVLGRLRAPASVAEVPS